MDIFVNDFELRGLSSKNVILGKNGCGKSFLMKAVEGGIVGNENYGLVRYISPERGGTLMYEPGIDQQISQNVAWISNNRRRNQSADFRQQSATLFRRLEILVLREIETDHIKADYVPRRFEDTISQLNVLLERVYLERDNAKPFRIIDRDSGSEAQPSDISSGESELISLGIEILAFVKEGIPDKDNILLIDEPDVHLHPDLQARLARFMIDALAGKRVTLILSTHSTALLAGLAEDPETRVAFKRRQMPNLTFKAVSDIDRAILPIFGAHPLSNIFNEAPILLVEGEDDERIWQQSIRSSQGRIRLFPCVTESITRLSEYESEVNIVIETVYDSAKGFSLRDRDDGPEEITDIGNVIRMRLSCRAAENLMLSDDVLASTGTTWTEVQTLIQAWSDNNTHNRYHESVQGFIDGGFDRRGHDLKDIRNILVALISTKPWEVLVGQGIAALAVNGGQDIDGSLRNYLGTKVCENLLGIPPLTERTT